MQRQVLVKKAEKVQQIKSLIREYEAIGIASLHKVRASQLQELRRKLEETAHLWVIKNVLMERAISESEGTPNIEKLGEYVKGSNLFLFTNLNPFKLVLLLERSKVKAFAKARDIATEDVIVPAGNTGLPPGPIISQLSSVGIQTRIESGSVWVNRDTVVARKGDMISESLAPVLSKLGIKSVEMGLSLKVVYDGGSIIPEEELKISLEEYKQNLSEAYMQALNLSLNAAYPTVENISMLIQAAAAEAYTLAFNASIPSSETIEDLIRKAHFEAIALASKIPESQRGAAE
ncbi:MAG: 50S ribosomal protein L10 [Candidatus Bathyarchaeota archaeon]|nr:50S ribosomal protein L10 [Candidatus Bathyarchaeota archaeon]